MKPLVIVGIIVAVLAFVFVGFLTAAGPEPHIVIPGEVLWKVGPLKITSTLLGAWLTMLILFVIAFFATRSIKLIPSGFQNLVEGFIEFLYGQVEEIGGKENANRFFIVVATFFIFILVGNWSALLPFYKAIGITKDYGQEIFHEIEHYAEEGKPIEDDHHFLAWEMDKASGIGWVNPGAGTFKFDLHAEEEPGEALDRYVVALAEQFTDFEAEDPEHPSEGDVEAAAAALEADPEAPQILHAEGEHAEHAVESPVLGAVSGIDFPGNKIALVYPFFRPAFSDMNNTLALALVAFVVIWYWGFSALGFRGYMGKFFIAPWKSPIMTFVGLLELLSEFIRIISFSFRLFGNIFAGSVLLLILTFLVPFLAPTGILALELFVGFIQAAVFALLVLVFGVGAVASHHEDEHEEGHGHHDDHSTAGVAQAH